MFYCLPTPVYPNSNYISNIYGFFFGFLWFFSWPAASEKLNGIWHFFCAQVSLILFGLVCYSIYIYIYIYIIFISFLLFVFLRFFGLLFPRHCIIFSRFLHWQRVKKFLWQSLCATCKDLLAKLLHFAYRPSIGIYVYVCIWLCVRVCVRILMLVPVVCLSRLFSVVFFDFFSLKLRKVCA